MPEQNLSDELLAKYLSGKTSPEETEQVLSFLAENDGNLDDFTQICAAIEVQKSAEKAAFAQKKAVRRRILWVASSAAAIALIVVVALFAFQPKENSNWVAQKTDSTQNTIVVPESEFTDNQNDSVIEKETNNAIAPNWRGEQPKNYAESTSKTGFCNMITPSQSKYAVSTQRTYFDFSWSTDAVRQTLILKDENGRIVHREEMQDEDYVKLKVADYQKYGKLSWTLVLTYSSGATETKTGDIVFEN